MCVLLCQEAQNPSFNVKDVFQHGFLPLFLLKNTAYQIGDYKFVMITFLSNTPQVMKIIKIKSRLWSRICKGMVSTLTTV